MARTLHVYPKAILAGQTWTFLVKVIEPATGTVSRIGKNRNPPITAGVTATESVVLLKVTFKLIVADTDTDQDVDDALFLDDIQPGGNTLTVWEDWQALAESIYAPGDTLDSFWDKWTTGDTQQMRNSANRALVSGPGGIGRGWTITAVHQHEAGNIGVDL